MAKINPIKHWKTGLITILFSITNLLPNFLSQMAGPAGLKTGQTVCFFYDFRHCFQLAQLECCCMFFIFIIFKLESFLQQVMEEYRKEAVEYLKAVGKSFSPHRVHLLRRVTSMTRESLLESPAQLI